MPRKCHAPQCRGAGHRAGASTGQAALAAERAWHKWHKGRGSAALFRSQTVAAAAPPRGAAARGAARGPLGAVSLGLRPALTTCRPGLWRLAAPLARLGLEGLATGWSGD